MKPEDVPSELMTLAAQALRDWHASGAVVMCEHTQFVSYGEAADQMLAAILPAHERQVREEIAAEIEAACPDPDTAHAAGHCDYRHAAQIARGEAR